MKYLIILLLLAGCADKKSNTETNKGNFKINAVEARCGTTLVFTASLAGLDTSEFINIGSVFAGEELDYKLKEGTYDLFYNRFTPASGCEGEGEGSWKALHTQIVILKDTTSTEYFY